MNSKKAKIVVIEGTEGVGKTTQTDLLVSHLRSRGFKVLQTKEPGSPHSELTMILRSIMLDNKFDNEMTQYAREFISQAIRSIHLERVIMPALDQYDFIVQDRGILSGYAYGLGCGNTMSDLSTLSSIVTRPLQLSAQSLHRDMYHAVIYLKGNVESSLNRALTSKQEFETGDAMESRGPTFINNVSSLMDHCSSLFCTIPIDVNNKSISEVHSEIVEKLLLKDYNE